MIATGPFVDGLGVLTALARQAVANGDLPADLKVFTKNVDHQTDFFPYLVISRVGGGDRSKPEFQSQFFVHMQVWCGQTDEQPDPYKAAYDLSLAVARVYYAAYKQQTLAYDGDGHVIGWICKWRESTGFYDKSDPDVPHAASYYGVYDLLIRNRRPNSV